MKISRVLFAALCTLHSLSRSVVQITSQVTHKTLRDRLDRLDPLSDQYIRVCSTLSCPIYSQSELMHRGFSEGIRPMVFTGQPPVRSRLEHLRSRGHDFILPHVPNIFTRDLLSCVVCLILCNNSIILYRLIVLSLW